VQLYRCKNHEAMKLKPHFTFFVHIGFRTKVRFSLGSYNFYSPWSHANVHRLSSAALLTEVFIIHPRKRFNSIHIYIRCDLEREQLADVGSESILREELPAYCRLKIHLFPGCGGSKRGSALCGKLLQKRKSSFLASFIFHRIR
jgi:hypothetical protein